MKTTMRCGQPSWVLSSDRVTASITLLGGHIAPVNFRLPHGTIQPFAIAPWAKEKSRAKLPPLLQALRGDFFCLPFGGNATPYGNEKHPPHGNTANTHWRFVSLDKSPYDTRLHLRMRSSEKGSCVDKYISLRHGETALYCQHVLSGMTGRINPGHHALLQCPAIEGSAHLSISPLRFAQVLPTPFENPADGGYSFLQTGGIFSNLQSCPALDGNKVDISRFPARRGFDDLVMLIHESRHDLAWTAVTFPAQGYVWFALKDPRILRSTVLWMSNGGRHYAPWNGRHTNVLGVEDVTAYFHYGLAESAGRNPINRRGFSTSLPMKANTPLTINYIMAVAAIPGKFDRVRDITIQDQGVTLHSYSGCQLPVSIQLDFLWKQPDCTSNK